MASIPPSTHVTPVTSATKLSDLQRLLRERGVSGGRGRMIRSIQQSMRVEGHDVSEAVVGDAVDRVLGKSLRP